MDPKLPESLQETDKIAESGSEAPKDVRGKRKGDLDPTRYGDWELNGRCIDF